MGISNNIVFLKQREFTVLIGKIAFLGFDKKPNHFDTKNYDCYDIQLDNFDINSEWSLKGYYDTIVCYRTLLFCKNNTYFFKKCYEHLNLNGELFIDYAYGAVSDNFFRQIGPCVGFYKNDIQQYCTYKTNVGENIYSDCLTSYWNDDLIKDINLINFHKKLKEYGYTNEFKKHLYDEIPIVVTDDIFKNYFLKKKTEVHYWMLKDRPSMIIYLNLIKK